MNSLKRALIYLGVAVLGFVIGGFSLYVQRLRSGPALELWHSVQLTSEFSVDRLGEISSLAEYFALEDRLFAELDAKVYAKTATGANLALARYSAGSIADPRGFEPDWNRSFELPAASPQGGVLLLHGMSDSPYSLRALGESLNERGFWVVGLRLPGHGTVPSGLTNATWEDMAAAVSLAAKHLGSVAGADAVHVFGYSTGAPLALHHTLEVMNGAPGEVPASLVLISPAIAVSPAAGAASWLRLFSTIPGLDKLAWTQIVPEFDPFKYNSFAVNAGDQVHRLTRRVASEIEGSSESEPIAAFPPTLVFLSTVDATVSAAAVIDNLLEHLAADQHELVLFDINRNKVKSTLLVSDPAPLTRALMQNDSLPFHLTIVGNENAQSDRVVARRKGPFSTSASSKPLHEKWPLGAISLSHVALPFPSDDPLYGARPADSDDVLHLGDIAFKGERGLLLFPADWLLRLRHNPFYDYLEQRSLDWVEASR